MGSPDRVGRYSRSEGNARIFQLVAIILPCVWINFLEDSVGVLSPQFHGGTSRIEDRMIVAMDYYRAQAPWILPTLFFFAGSLALGFLASLIHRGFLAQTRSGKASSLMRHLDAIRAYMSDSTPADAVTDGPRG